MATIEGGEENTEFRPVSDAGIGPGLSEDTVLELFQTAALILGSQQEAITTVEQAVATVQADPCAEPGKALAEGRELLVALAVKRAVALNVKAFRPDGSVAGPEVCIDTDELASTGVTTEQLARLLSGPDRPRLRDWLENLKPDARVVFVLRAMLNKDNAAVAADLQQANAGMEWNIEQVGRVFRGALCSLATSLVREPVAG